MKTLTLFLMLSFVLIFAVTNDSDATTYKWVDSKGGMHFSDNPEAIPAKYRKQATTLDSGPVDKAPSQDNAASVLQKQAEPAQSASPPNELSAPVKGRSYWQSRFNTLRAELKKLKDGLDTKRVLLSDHRRKWLLTQKRVERQTMNKLEEEIGKDEERIKDLGSQLEALDVEAARNAVPLEWRK